MDAGSASYARYMDSSKGDSLYSPLFIFFSCSDAGAVSKQFVPKRPRPLLMGMSKAAGSRASFHVIRFSHSCTNRSFSSASLTSWLFEEVHPVPPQISA